MVTFNCLEIMFLSNSRAFLLCIHVSKHRYPRCPTSLESSKQCYCSAAGMRLLSMITQTKLFLSWLVQS